MFVRRILRAYARRVGDGDIEALAIMLGLADEIDAAIVEAVKGVRAYGLLLDRNRRTARHHPPGGPATMGNVVTGPCIGADGDRSPVQGWDERESNS